MTITNNDVNVDAFLEHFGVKGMKWGVRREKSPAYLKKYGGKDKTKRTATQKRNRDARLVRRVNNTVSAVSVGIFVAGLILNNVSPAASSPGSSSGPRSSGPRMSSSSKPSASVADLLNKERDVKISAINRTFREGFMDAAQREQFTNAMNARYDRKIAEAVG